MEISCLQSTFSTSCYSPSFSSVFYLWLFKKKEEMDPPRSFFSCLFVLFVAMLLQMAEVLRFFLTMDQNRRILAVCSIKKNSKRAWEEIRRAEIDLGSNQARGLGF